LIDNHLIKYGYNEFTQHYKNVEQWKIDCKKHIQRSILKKLRIKQFESAVDDEHMLRIVLVRKQTRYKQKNYVRSAYNIYITIAQYSYNLYEMKQRYDDLANIDFECTLTEYNSKEQRKRMTAALKEKIAKRDNYTCQICGKYMPDGVGLHIDHIIPIKKGGKSIPSNLQVLCSKCNGKKSSN
jgi:HNH endonuclease domain protein